MRCTINHPYRADIPQQTSLFKVNSRLHFPKMEGGRSSSTTALHAKIFHIFLRCMDACLYILSWTWTVSWYIHVLFIVYLYGNGDICMQLATCSLYAAHGCSNCICKGIDSSWVDIITRGILHGHTDRPTTENIYHARMHLASACYK